MTVQLTLMRHGIAESYAASDAERSLTPEGMTQVSAVARALVASGWRPGSVVHSPLKRAVQTAALVMAELPEPVEVVELEEVVNAGQPLLDMLGHLGLPDPLVVGHLPSIASLTSQLLACEGIISFNKATVACLRVNSLPPRTPAQLVFFAPASLLAPR